LPLHHLKNGGSKNSSQKGGSLSIPWVNSLVGYTFNSSWLKASTLYISELHFFRGSL